MHLKCQKYSDIQNKEAGSSPEDSFKVNQIRGSKDRYYKHSSNKGKICMIGNLNFVITKLVVTSFPLKKNRSIIIYYTTRHLGHLLQL